MDLYQVCSNGGPGVQNGPAAGGLGFKKEIYLKNLLLQNCLAQGLEIWYIALPGGPFTKFVQTKVPGSKMAPRRGS